VVDEFTRECLAIRVARKLGAAGVIDVLADLFIARGAPTHICSDNNAEFTASTVKGWIAGSFSFRARRDDAMWTAQSAYAACRIVSTAVARRR
jgi:hypothetical protein